MAFDVNKIIKGRQSTPRKICIYGEGKIGKSSLAAAAEDSFVIVTEDRLSEIDAAKTPVLKSYNEVHEVLEWLITADHGFKNLVVDTIDWLEPLLHKYICEKKGFSSLTDSHNKETMMQNGLKYHAVEGWKNFLHNLDVLRLEKGMNIILLAHSLVEKRNPPEGEQYDRYSMKIDKHAAAVIQEWVDAVGFYHRPVMVKTVDAGFNQKKGKALAGEDVRILSFSPTNPAWVAGNSFGFDSDFEVSKDQIKDVMQYILTENNN